MFPDQFLPNLAIFAAGVATAVAWLRTGMLWRGVALLALLLLAADAALLVRFALAERGPAYLAVLTAMQIAALGAAVWLLVALVRRRWSGDTRRRRELFASAFQHYLRDELEQAQGLLVRLRRADPWDVPAAVALGNVLRRRGLVRQARAMYRAARNLDRKAEYTDFIGLQLQRLPG